MLAAYIHDLNPVLWDITDAIKLRWYGLAYLAGFVGGYFLLLWQAKRNQWPLNKAETGDFITYAAFFGVFLGGRLGHLLFYYTRDHGPDWMWQDPLLLFRVWEGGMASHGGVLGLVIFTYVFARRKKVSWLAIGDGLVTVAPIGLFCGRMANFINGEIYGRVAHGLSWAVKFPATLREVAPESQNFSAAMAAAVEADDSLIPAYHAWIDASNQAEGAGSGPMAANALYDAVIERSRENDAVLEAVGTYLEPRHPAQVYEALVEGALLFAILFGIRVLFPQLRRGVLTALFFILYAIGRISIEQYKLAETADIGGWKMGAFLSFFMLAGGIAFLVYALCQKPRDSGKAT